MLGQPQRCVGVDRPLSVHDGADSAGRDANIPSQLVDADAQWLQELLGENLVKKLSVYMNKSSSSLQRVA